MINAVHFRSDRRKMKLTRGSGPLLHCRRLAWIFVWLVCSFVVPAHAAGEDETAIRAVIAAWYSELAKKSEGRTGDLVTRAFIEASPRVTYADTGSAALGPALYTSLPATALRFRYDIEGMRVDPNFARVSVWERGYFYAYAAQATYELASDAAFILEREEVGGRWRIAAHRAETVGIPPNKITSPMPDLHDLFYATEGKNRDPVADAKNAGKF